MSTIGLANHTIVTSGAPTDVQEKELKRMTNVVEGTTATTPCLQIIKTTLSDMSRTCPYAIAQKNVDSAPTVKTIPDVQGTENVWHDFMANIDDNEMRHLLGSGVDAIASAVCEHCREKAWLATAPIEEVTALYEEE